MALTVDATYENGVLRLSQPLPLQEHEQVRVTILTPSTWVQETAGMVKWNGDPETLRRLVKNVEFDPLEDE